jgi:hypothetical protein
MTLGTQVQYMHLELAMCVCVYFLFTVRQSTLFCTLSIVSAPARA